MNTYSITQLAREFDLSRSTLLYYDRINLLRAPVRTRAGYRVYTPVEHEKLKHICVFRDAGVSLADIRSLLSNDTAPSVGILQKRMLEIGDQILRLRSQQHLILAMLKNMTGEITPPVIDKQTWVKMLESAGMDEDAMTKWHSEFERCSSQAHYDFLLFLGISEDEARQIQKWSQEKGRDG